MWFARINYLTLIILIIAGMLFYNNYALLFMLILLLVLPVISYFIARFNKDKISVDIYTDKTSVGKNSSVGVCFSVNNKSILSMENFTLVVKIYNAFYGNEKTYEIIIPAASYSERKATLTIENKYCGRMVVSLEEIRGYDLFGMYRFTKSLNKTKEVMVMPYGAMEIENLPLSLQGKSDDEELQFKKGDDVSQISQIRNYIPGDKLQNIHWKLSAKAEELQVKEFSMPYSDDVILLIELYSDKDNPDIFDELIEKLFAISVYIIKQGRKFYISWYDKMSEDFYKKEVNNDDELMEAIIDLYYAGLLDTDGRSYEIYERIYGLDKSTVIYLSDKAGKPKGGSEIDINSERVVLTCLN